MADARLTVPGLLVLLAAGTAIPAASAASADVVETVPLEGRILADSGSEEVGSAYTSGVKLTVGDWPNGSLEVPPGAGQARFSLAVDQPAGRQASLGLTVCEPACNVMDPNPAPLATDRGAQRLETTVDVASLDTLGWVVRSEGEPAANISVDGEARFLAGTEAAPAEGAAPRQAPVGDADGPLELGLWVGAASAILVAWRGLRRWLPPSIGALYHRIDRDELLDHPTRERIYAIVGEEPGVHFGELKRRTDSARGSLDHHLHRLVEAGLLEERSFDGYRCFFRRAEVPEDVLGVADRLRCRTARRVLQAVVREPGSRTTEIQADLPAARSTVSYHLHRLHDAGLVEREPDGTSARLHPTELGRRALAVLGGR